MATNEQYRKGIKIPLTVGASIAARTPMCVGKLPIVTLTKTIDTGTQIATCLAKGVVDVTVDSACDAVTLTLATVTNTQTLIVNATTYTAATSTTTWSTRTISIAGNDTADALLLAKAMNGGQYLTLGSVPAGETIVVAGLTFTAHTNTTTAASREFSIAGTDAQDAAELVTCLNDATTGIAPLGYVATQGAATGEILIQPKTLYPCTAYPTPAISVAGAAHATVNTLAPLPGCRASAASAVVTLTSSETISAVTGTASGATVTVDHAVTSTRNVNQGDSVYWTTPSTLNCKAETGTALFGHVTENGTIEDRKFTIASVTAAQTIIINGITFTAHGTTTTKSTKTFSISGSDTADGDELCACINDPIHGLVGFTATNASGTITLTYDGDIVITGTARVGGTLTTAPGSRKVQVKLGA